MARNYWLDLFTGTTWEEFQQAGSSITGFRESRWKRIQKVAKTTCYVISPVFLALSVS